MKSRSFFYQELEIQKQKEQERLTAAAAVAKTQQQIEEDYSNYIVRE